MNSEYRQVKKYMSQEDVLLFSSQCDTLFDFIETTILSPAMVCLLMDRIRFILIRATQAVEHMVNEIGPSKYEDDLYKNLQANLVKICDRVTAAYIRHDIKPPGF